MAKWVRTAGVSSHFIKDICQSHHTQSNLGTDALVTWTREGKGNKKEGKEGKSSDGWLSLSIIWTFCGKVEWSKNMPVHSFIHSTNLWGVPSCASSSTDPAVWTKKRYIALIPWLLLDSLSYLQSNLIDRSPEMINLRRESSDPMYRLGLSPML